ncbi:2-C-methyl-D-erythritol 2,4-cyclodiphosphate synthase [Candidatus Puniceispirillum marinum]|uniref:Bifunctional enzyme IspD/IspF n=1 Tax=Puniceispirillum marinum (strain IMCC1322) TaxID=488538 RepID=D5BPH4_PUNMI|nr:2-C-methyl-D-erythritol 2,4-cyclodiphosphate synthase [Candidatus Puniceispirillum marinum]ADE38456.1 4-diphosphocytidyl-2C-methyl-D-erythritol synthase [Candidatus Puniceispirillum marinum IMCC1322]
MSDFAPTSASPTVAAIIVAAGYGQRMTAPDKPQSENIPKQFRQLGGKPVICWSLDAFAQHENITRIILVVGQGQEAHALAIINQHHSKHSEMVTIVKGGASRMQSVRNGMATLSDAGFDGLVAIHDAARPLLQQGTLDALIGKLAISSAKDVAGVIPVLSVSDSLKQVKDNLITDVIDRDKASAAQTPQLFHFQQIAPLYDNLAHENVTDDASIAMSAGLNVATIAGSRSLMKLTYEDDFTFLEHLSRAAGKGQNTGSLMDIRLGNGFDVHKFGDTPGPITLCGIKIDSEFGLTAHSDGDVGLHALCDALFGALADGDIGSHFPPSDDKWKDADSARFLHYAVEKCHNAKATIMHLDLTLICEYPKITPHRDAMRKRIAEITGLDISRIAVKATTSEGLGFTGRREGIAAQATATICYNSAEPS